MRHQVAHRDVAFAVPLEAWDERRHAIAEPDLPSSTRIITLVVVATTLVSEATIEDRIERHRLGRGHERAVADRLLIERLVSAADQHDGAGQLLFGDRLRHQRLDRVQPSSVDLEAAWRGAIRVATSRTAASCFMQGL